MQTGGHADEFKQTQCFLAAMTLITRESGPVADILPCRNFMVDVKPGDHVVEYAELLEQTYLLKCAREADAHTPMRWHPGEIMAVEGQRPGIGLIDAADQIEKRRFSCTVRANDSENGAALSVQRNIGN